MCDLLGILRTDVARGSESFEGMISIAREQNVLISKLYLIDIKLPY